ncbi:hypothetical protein [Flavobacterium longum]
MNILIFNGKRKDILFGQLRRKTSAPETHFSATEKNEEKYYI